jgi:hypothetical protein
MSNAAPPAPADLAQRLVALEAAAATLQTDNQALRTENQLLRQKLDALLRRYFGSPKTETLDRHQLELLLAGLVGRVEAPAPARTAPAAPAAPASARKPARSGLPDDLPVERIVLVPDEVRAQPEHFRQIDELITKELDWEPAKFFWRHYVRPKFVRRDAPTQRPPPPMPTAPTSAPALLKVPVLAWALALAPIADEKEVFIAALPNRLIEKGLPGVGLLVHLILSRFEDHLPFYRLEKIFRERHGVPLSRQSMVDWTEQLATWFQPVYRQMVVELVASRYLQVDETPIRYLDREEPGRSCVGYFWTYSRPGGDVIFDWQTSRGRDGPAAFLQRFQGKLQTDGYAVYRALAQARADWLLFACWAHARRKFFEAKDHDRRAAWFLTQIGLLYALERRLRQHRAGPALRQAQRAAEAQMILSRIRRGLDCVGPQVLAQSQLGKAIHYTLDLWRELTRYADHGEVEIDTNLVENAIRPTAVGKKNFLFVGHPDAGWRSAVLYSILGSCRRHRINPADYLKDVLTRLPDMKQSEIPSVTPGAWAKAHPQARVLPPK